MAAEMQRVRLDAQQEADARTAAAQRAFDHRLKQLEEKLTSQSRLAAQAKETAWEKEQALQHNARAHEEALFEAQRKISELEDTLAAQRAQATKLESKARTA